MNFINKNLKQIGIFNFFLIVIGIAYDVVRLINFDSLQSLLAITMQLIAFVFTLNYALNEYKKDVAKSFKMFLYAYDLSIAATIISTLNHDKAPAIAIVLAVIRLICVALLAFVKDLGKTKSYVLSGTTLMSCIISIVAQAIGSALNFNSLIGTLSPLILSMVLFVSVVEKYNDKSIRGAK